MQTDEDQIRQLVATWMDATRNGDVDAILDLLTDDVVFLAPGRPPTRKDEFAAQARAQSGGGGPNVDGISEIQEIVVAGEWAFMWARLAVAMTPKDGGAVAERAGYTLSVLRKMNGKWRLSRDANLLAPVPRPSA